MRRRRGEQGKASQNISSPGNAAIAGKNVFFSQTHYDNRIFEVGSALPPGLGALVEHLKEELAGMVKSQWTE